TTTTANPAGAGEVTEAAGAGQSAAAVPGDRVAPPSRMPAVMLSLLLLVAVAGMLGVVRRSRLAALRAVVLRVPPSPGEGLL
ncbi:MAG: hypothetical protein ACRD0C_06625, partial [Acidimicrobiia bacterium]